LAASGAGAAGLVAAGAFGFAVEVDGLSCGGTGLTAGAAGTEGAALSSTFRRAITPESTVFCWSLIAGDKVMNAFLWLQPFVEVLVSGHHHVDAIFQKQGLELIA
jgi:hypothetical protein